LVKLNQQ